MIGIQHRVRVWYCDMCRRFVIGNILSVCRCSDPNLQGVFLARTCAIWEFRRRMVMFFLVTGVVSRKLRWNLSIYTLDSVC